MFEILGCNPSEPIATTTVAPVLISGQTPTAQPPIGVNATPTAMPHAGTGEPGLTKTTPKFGQTIAVPMPNFAAPPRGKIKTVTVEDLTIQ